MGSRTADLKELTGAEITAVGFGHAPEWTAGQEHRVQLTEGAHSEDAAVAMIESEQARRLLGGCRLQGFGKGG